MFDIQPAELPAKSHKVNLTSSPRCPRCAYQLTGLPRYGTCPECGKVYTPFETQILTPWPRSIQIIWRLGWPVAGMAFCQFVVSMSQNLISISIFGLGFVLFFMLTYVNAVLQRSMWLQQHQPSGACGRERLGEIWRNAPAYPISFFLAIVLPIVLMIVFIP